MTVVLTVMSGMDLHMISWNLGWVQSGWEFGQSYCLGRTTTVDSVLGLMLCFEEKRC
jgi:hypothetical protein